MIYRQHIINSSQRHYLIMDEPLDKKDADDLINFMIENRMAKCFDAIVTAFVPLHYTPPEDYIDVSYIYSIYLTMKPKRFTS
jgi:hypothetical protein